GRPGCGPGRQQGDQRVGVDERHALGNPPSGPTCAIVCPRAAAPARSSSGPGRHPLKVEIAGSNPARVTSSKYCENLYFEFGLRTLVRIPTPRSHVDARTRTDMRQPPLGESTTARLMRFKGLLPNLCRSRTTPVPGTERPAAWLANQGIGLEARLRSLI